MRRSGTGTSVVERREMKAFQQVIIKISAENAHRHGAWIGICGELAADTSLTETFLKMGIDELSVSPGFVLKVRNKVRNIDLSSTI